MNKNLSILLIDHNMIDNYVNQKIFESIGINDVEIKNTSKEAIVYLYNNDIIPNYIFIDINMPHNNGFEIIRKLKKINISVTETIFCFLSNSLNPDDKLKAQQIEVNIIDKPLTIEKLNNILN